MGSETIPTKLKDICLKIGSGATPRGGKEAYFTSGISLIRSQNVIDFSFSYDGLAFINDEQAAQLNNVTIQENDVLINITGDSVARVCMVPKDVLPARVNQHVSIIRPNSRADSKYLLYFLQHEKPHLLSIGSCGGTRNALTKEMLENLELELPLIEEQKRISATLSCLDDKIELNNRIIANLEAQAQAIFKSWFVDFEPFQDGEFEESELGSIPKGWRVSNLGALCESVSITHDFKKRELVFLNTGDIDQGRFLHSNYSLVDLMPGQAKKSIKKHDILYSEIRPINKHFAYVNFDSEDYVVSTKLMVIRSKRIHSRRLYQFLTKQDVMEELQVEAEARSGTFPQIRFDNIQRMLIILATKVIEEKYNAILEPLYQLMDQRIDENMQLSLVRDTLLPKLMSGEIEVPTN